MSYIWSFLTFRPASGSTWMVSRELPSIFAFCSAKRPPKYRELLISYRQYLLDKLYSVLPCFQQEIYRHPPRLVKNDEFTGINDCDLSIPRYADLAGTSDYDLSEIYIGRGR